ncbi:hypothetical protein [Lutibacter sp.]|uniref:hypothetical protein n=1 Tax=Lutibacter sp. TaxID=1925666 RepID=UPI00273601FD|nr:hypothetical protein [Lutibacter sp.]MDP3313191.1 hypothetical protein [Lutibacter sp.]
METTLLISKIIGLVYLSFGIGLIFNKKYYLETFTKLMKSSSFMILAGFLAITFGLLILEFHPYWDNSLAIVISIIGYIALIKGIIILAFPTSFSFFKVMLKSEKMYLFLGPLVLLFGVLFSYLGFFS